MPPTSNPKTTQKTKTTLDEQIKVAHEVLWAVCAFLIFIVVGFLLTPKARQPVAPPAPEIERVEEGLPFPRLANTYYRTVIRTADINMLSGWDLIAFAYVTDRNANNRSNLELIESENPDIIFLIYHGSWEAGDWDNPPDPLWAAAEECDWWLYHYEGYPLRNELWDVDTINMTNEEAADGVCEGEYANEFLPEDLVINHLQEYDFWDGIFYDVFTDNLQWFYLNQKDANRNGTPEFDLTQNENEPIFNNIWQQGMITLLQNTLSLEPDAILVGNGLHRFATPYLNGKYGENYSPSSHNLSSLEPEYRYITYTGRDQAITILNGVPVGLHDPTDYRSMRFGLGSSLLVGSYYLFNSGSRHHKDTFWYDEYNIMTDGINDGEVAAITTILEEDIDSTQLDIPVVSTNGFPVAGVITIDGEQIYYDHKDDTHFYAMNSYYGRGYPSTQDGEEYDHRAPHESGATVIYHDNSYTGYLGFPVSDAYDINEPSVKLNDLYEECGWVCGGQQEDDINSRVWRRSFDNGIVILNPRSTPVTLTVNGTGSENNLILDGSYRLINGLQDPNHNNGATLTDGYQLRIESQDSYILIKTQETGSLNITLSGDSSVPQGGTMNIQVTVENNTSGIVNFDVWFDLTREQTRENIIEPFNDYQLGSGDTGVYEQSQGIPPRSDPDTYTLTAYVGPNFKDHDVYEDSASLEFTVTEVPCQFNCQEATPLEFEIEGSTIRIWREAERSTITSPMTRAKDPEASDSRYILTPDGTGNGNGDPEDGQAQYTINIPDTGNWVIWGRVQAPKGADNQTNDSFFVKMDDGADLTWDLFQNAPGPYQDTWGWDEISSRGTGGIGDPEFDPMVFNLSEGTHTLIIKNREDGAELDKLLITNDMDYVPEKG